MNTTTQIAKNIKQELKAQGIKASCRSSDGICYRAIFVKVAQEHEAQARKIATKFADESTVINVQAA